MDTAELMAISPLDGRYHDKVNALRAIFSEYGLIKYRLTVEIRWLQMLAEFAELKAIPRLSSHANDILNRLIDDFSLQDAARIKHIESGIHHDVKAVEYFIKERIAGNAELAAISEFVHFGCTSEDINNLAYGMMLHAARSQIILPALDDVMNLQKKFAHDYADLAMLSRTHGQAASPTTLGKEMANVAARLQRQRDQLINHFFLGKLNGASGNYNALHVTYPDVDWQTFSKNFVCHLGLQWNPYTTQIEPHDSLSEFFAIIQRINTILIDFNRDLWQYIAIHYFKQQSFANEVGSSTMPHKVNPIDFENAEGNLGLSNALLIHMAEKLPISRWQRDLSDSTVLRNIGVAIAHAYLAYRSTVTGLEKLHPNETKITEDLNQHWEVLAEAIQTIMRRYGLPEPYERLKSFTRGKIITKELLQHFIVELELPDQVIRELIALTPQQYTGYAETLAKRI